MQRYAVMILIVLLVLAGCGDDNDNDNGEDKLPPTFTPAVMAPELVTLQMNYEALRESHDAIADVWRKLDEGQSVSCNDQPVMTQRPEDITRVEADSAYLPLADTLLAAAVDTENAINTWRRECRIRRNQPDPSVIREGLGYVIDAGLALD